MRWSEKAGKGEKLPGIQSSPLCDDGQQSTARCCSRMLLGTMRMPLLAAKDGPWNEPVNIIYFALEHNQSITKMNIVAVVACYATAQARRRGER